jgi:broad specificity phosphatase PhoE
MSRRVVLVRHPPVDASFRGVCYGQSDVPLGADGRAMIPALAADIVEGGTPDVLYSSGLTRCQHLADAVAELCMVEICIDARLRERHFGEWELQTWNEIHTATGDAIMGMLTDPAGWRPPGGETTFELRDRVLSWYAGLPNVDCVLAITHGGPIAALLGTLRGVPVNDWPGLIPAPGANVSISRNP